MDTDGKRFIINAIPGSNGRWWEVRDRLVVGAASRVASFSSDEAGRNRYAADRHAKLMNGDLPDQYAADA